MKLWRIKGSNFFSSYLTYSWFRFKMKIRYVCQYETLHKIPNCTDINNYGCSVDFTLVMNLLTFQWLLIYIVLHMLTSGRLIVLEVIGSSIVSTLEFRWSVTYSVVFKVRRWQLKWKYTKKLNFFKQSWHEMNGIFRSILGIHFWSS